MFFNDNVPERIQKLVFKTIKDMEKANIKFAIEKVTEIKMCRAKTYTGICQRLIKGKNNITYSIKISKYLISDKDITSTIAHELIHTKIWDHNIHFKNEVDKLVNSKPNNYLHFYGNENYGSDDLEIDFRSTTSKYTLICNDCGHEYYYDRKNRIINNYHRFHCKCGGKLTLKQNY